jgi:hypothetical protein
MKMHGRIEQAGVKLVRQQYAQGGLLPQRMDQIGPATYRKKRSAWSASPSVPIPPAPRVYLPG